MLSVTYEEALRRASFCLKEAGIEGPVIEAEIMLAHLLKTDRLQLFLKRAEILPRNVESSFSGMVERRIKGEPAAYITGEKYFFGRPFQVNENVLIPRPETELIIERALQFSMNKSDTGITEAIDLGTGSGVLAVTLAAELPDIHLSAVDISREALALAAKNAMRHAVAENINFYEGDYFDALSKVKPRPRFNMVLSNPPYLSSEEIEKLPREIKFFEPVEALHGGEDGMDGYRKIMGGIAKYTGSRCLVLLEIGSTQQEAVYKMCIETGLFKKLSWHRDLAGHPRVIEGETVS